MEHKNHITNPAFKEGILEALGYKIDELPEEEKDRIVKDVEENWWFCGGKDTQPESEIQCPYDQKEWYRLWTHYFGDKQMPPTTGWCVCRQDGLRYNLYITDGNRIITIGSVCMYQFLPRIARQVKEKRCEECRIPHQNRKDNYCSECRIIRKRQQREAEKERKRNEERAKMEEAIQKRIEEHKREMERRKRDEEQKRYEEEQQQARQCRCGGWKRPEYPVCWECHQKELSNMSEMDKKKYLCACGKRKKPQYTTCWICYEKGRE